MVDIKLCIQYVLHPTPAYEWVHFALYLSYISLVRACSVATRIDGTTTLSITSFTGCIHMPFSSWASN